MTREEKITAHALIDALDSVVWYNGLGETLRKWRYAAPDVQDSLVPYTMYWNKEIDINEYNQLQIIWMICVVLFGDYWNCLFWTGAVFTTVAYPKNQFKKTGIHFGIDKIMEEMRNG